MLRRLSFWKWAVVIAVVVLGTGAALIRLSDRNGESGHPSAAKGVACFGRVDLEDGCTSLTFQQPGQVLRVNFREGDFVAKDKVLAEMDDKTAELQEREAQAACQAAHGQVQLAEQGVGRHEAALEAEEAAVQAADRRVLAAHQALRRQKQLQEKNNLDISEV